MKPRPLSRRLFTRASTGTAAALAAGVAPAITARAAGEAVVVGVMGLGGRGTFLAERFAQRKDVRIAYLCDPDRSKFARAREAVEELDHNPKIVQDFRKMLEDKSLDAIVNATPDHWHALGSVLACKAGKDVYVEKPMAHNIYEGRKMIEASQKYGRVIQVGTQSRSCEYMASAREQIASGKLGDIHLVRVYNMMEHGKMSPPSPSEPPPGFDYEIWCGPAEKRPYDRARRWLNMWEYSCGPIAGDAVHQLDLARMLMGDPKAPRKVSHSGGIFALKDGRDTPDTQLATLEYDSFTLLFQASLWTPYMKKIPANVRDNDLFPEWPFCATKIEVLGTKGCMLLGRHGGGWQIFDKDDKLAAQSFGRQADAQHIGNFIDCIRSRKQPVANAEQGHYSVLISHLANIAYRVGNKTLTFDPKTESFPDCPEANNFARRASYREPWTMPDPV